MSTVTNLNRYQRRKEKTKQELLAAARKVLAEKGYHNAKIIDIAAAADIGVGTFYLYYPTKDALFLELVEETARALKEDIDAARSTVEGAVEKLREANRAFFQFAQKNRDLLKIIFGHGNTFNALLRQVYAMFVADATDRVTEGVNRKEFRPLPPPVVANALVGMAAQVVSWWIDQEEPSVEAMAEMMTDFILHGLGCASTAQT
ncbi:MAG TPA: TetR/AcrR family transcriptional regulator [Methylomirabilota bacterium]|jgi:AcrR family transcriptional regulator|nr:TetR/AcrR family transcriptional regulator [Methylomirabilota bacterium]